MDRQLKVIYHYHSGFSVQIGSTLLVFDYWEGEKDSSLPQVGCITPQFLQAFERIFVFISHSHPDHFDHVVYSWEAAGLNVTYIVAADMPVGIKGKRLAPLQTRELTDDISVQAFNSTDLGVSYLVTAYGFRIFHAGDLNLWHWRNESSLEEIENAEKAFYDALEPIKGHVIDVAMFPVDPRQGRMYDAGANHFIMTIKPRVFIPMHWWERSEVAAEFARHATNAYTEVLALNRSGMSADMTFRTDHTLDIRVIEPPKDYSELPGSMSKTSDPFSGNDPFADTDLPVDL